MRRGVGDDSPAPHRTAYRRVPPTSSHREVEADWSRFPRYTADRSPQAGAEPTLRCVDCGQTAFELFHGRCAPCAIRAEIPLRQKDREVYASRVNAGMSPALIRHVRPMLPRPLPVWHWRRWWPWAKRRRATDIFVAR